MFNRDECWQRTLKEEPPCTDA